jgi:putative addiction module component (TIGR02574 family)
MSSQMSDFDSMNLAEKLELVENLWDRIAASSEALPVPDWQKEELDRREENHRANPTPGISWEEAKKRIRGE